MRLSPNVDWSRNETLVSRDVGKALATALSLATGNGSHGHVYEAHTADGTFYVVGGDANPSLFGHEDAKCRLGYRTKAAKTLNTLRHVATVTKPNA